MDKGECDMNEVRGIYVLDFKNFLGKKPLCTNPTKIY